MPRRKQTNYLWQRSNTDVFWFSRAVPKHLQSIVGRRVIQKSLGTTDRRVAEALARRTAADLDEKWGLLAPAQRIPSTDELDEAAVTWGFDLYTDFVARGRSC